MAVLTNSELGALFQTGMTITQPNLQSIFDSMAYAADLTTLQNQLNPVAGTTPVQSVAQSGLQVYRMNAGGVYSYNGFGDATAAVTVPTTGFQLATTTDFPELNEVVSSMGVIGYTYNGSGIDQLFLVQLDGEGVTVFPSTGSSQTIASGDALIFSATCIIPGEG